MPNSNTPKGMAPHGEPIRLRPYVASGTVYPGDTVAIATDGKVSSSITVPLLGVAMNYAIAGQEVLIADHPDQLFEVESTTSLAQADMAANYSLVLGTASTLYKRSALYLDSATIATTATLAVKALGFVPSVNNAAGSANVDVVVKINNHVLNGGTGSAGLA